MSTGDGIATGKGHAGQTVDQLAQQLARLSVDRRALTFTNGEIGLRPLGRIQDPTGDTPAEITLRALLALLRQRGDLL